LILKVGLTGGIASGKSTVAKLLEQEGFLVIDADRIVHELYEPGAAGSEAVAREFGSSMLDENGRVDRKRLAAVAMETPAAAARLNAIIHPLVIEQEQRRLAAVSAGVALVEATLLLEAGGRARYDRIIVVDLPEALQLERGVARGASAEEVRRRMNNQMPRKARLAQADYVILNDGSLDALREKTAEIATRLRADYHNLTGQ
jgi:dephospho-CoA kinase